MKIFDKCKINEIVIAILIDEKEKAAYEAVWDENAWNIDFSYFALGIDSSEVAENLDFEGAREAGYKFVN